MGFWFATESEALSHHLSNDDNTNVYLTHPYVNIANSLFTALNTIACLYLLCRINHRMAVLPPVALAGGALGNPTASPLDGVRFIPISRGSLPRAVQAPSSEEVKQMGLLLAIIFCILLVLFMYEFL